MSGRLLWLMGAAVLCCGACAEVKTVTSDGQPDEAGFAEYAENGYRVVVDLRTDAEDRGLDEPAVVEKLGMRYVSLPVAGADGINFENAKKLDDLLAGSDGPVLLHCGSGNRVGALMALRAKLNGASNDEALAVGEEYGMTRLRGRVEKLLAKDE